MIRIKVVEGDNGKWTVSETDGRNGKVLVSSTSQGYDRRSRGEETARRIAPRGDEVVELVTIDRAGKVLLRVTLHDPSAPAVERASA